VPAQPTTVTMTVNNKAVKGRAGSLYSQRIREGTFSETHIQLCESLSDRTGAMGRFVP
jgi:hypothetical protein